MTKKDLSAMLTEMAAIGDVPSHVCLEAAAYANELIASGRWRLAKAGLREADEVSSVSVEGVSDG